MTCRQQMKWKVGNFLGETVTLKPRFLTLGGRALLLSIVVPHTLLLASVVGQAHCCSVVTVNTKNIVQPLTLRSSSPDLELDRLKSTSHYFATLLLLTAAAGSY